MMKLLYAKTQTLAIGEISSMITTALLALHTAITIHGGADTTIRGHLDHMRCAAPVEVEALVSMPLPPQLDKITHLVSLFWVWSSWVGYCSTFPTKILLAMPSILLMNKKVT